MRSVEMDFGVAALGFVVTNFALSILTASVWRGISSRRHRASTLFALRMIPSVGSVLLTLGLLVPAFLLFEPAATSEHTGPDFVLFVLIGAALVAAGLVRALHGWRTTRRLERLWLTLAGRRLRLGRHSRAYRVASEMPFAALIGLVRPRLFVADRFLDTLTARERQALLDHEAGHVRSQDNLKRTVMRLAPDVLSILPGGRSIERAWAAAAEDEADDFASGPDGAGALDLASALLKAVRTAPVEASPASNFCNQGTIARRVARLLTESPQLRRSAALRLPVLLAVPFLAAAVVLVGGPAFRAAYALTEAAVRLLQ